MLMSARAGLAGVLAAAFLALAALPGAAADKAYQDAELEQAAIKLEAQIKSDAGEITKPAAQLLGAMPTPRSRRRLPRRHDRCSGNW